MYSAARCIPVAKVVEPDLEPDSWADHLADHASGADLTLAVQVAPVQKFGASKVSKALRVNGVCQHIPGPTDPATPSVELTKELICHMSFVMVQVMVTIPLGSDIFPFDLIY